MEKRHIIAMMALSLLMAGCAGKHVSTSEAKPTNTSQAKVTNASEATKTQAPIRYVVSKVIANIDSSIAQDRLARARKYNLVSRIENKVSEDLQKTGNYDTNKGRVALYITVTSFRLRSGAAAFWLGVMDGADILAVDVKVEQGNKTLQTFNTNTSTALGGLIFPAPSERLNRMVKALSKRIIKDLG